MTFTRTIHIDIDTMRQMIQFMNYTLLTFSCTFEWIDSNWVFDIFIWPNRQLYLSIWDNFLLCSVTYCSQMRNRRKKTCERMSMWNKAIKSAWISLYLHHSNFRPVKVHIFIKINCNYSITHKHYHAVSIRASQTYRVRVIKSEQRKKQPCGFSF